MSRFLLLRVSTLPFDALAPLRAGNALQSVEGLLTEEDAFTAGAADLSALLHARAGERDEQADAERARTRLAFVRLRRDVHNARPLREADRIAAERAAAASPGATKPGRGGASIVDDLRRYADSLDRLTARRRAFGERFQADLIQARKALCRIVREPFFDEGVGLASRALPAQLSALVERDPAAWTHAERLAATKGTAYLARFTTKTSPNALFCATSPVAAGGASAFLEGRADIERVDVLLNIYEAGKVAACLAASRDADPVIVPRPNPTLRESEEGLTFWKPATARNPGDEEVLSRVKDHPVLRAFLAQASSGELVVATLIGAVAARFELDPAEVETFYRSLVERGILIAEVEIPYNARRPLQYLAGACRASGCSAPWIETLERLEADVDRIPRLEAGARRQVIDEVGDAMERLPHVRALKRDELFRFDAASSLRVGLPARLIEELRISLRAYVRMFSAIYPARMYELSLADRFLERYPPDRDIEFLDLYHGLLEPQEIERPSAFPDPAGLARPGTGVEEAAATMRRLRDHFARRARETTAGEEIRLEEDDVSALVGEAPEPRWSAGVLFQIAAREVRDLEAGPYRLVLSALFPGVGLALARFFHLHGGGASADDNPIVRELKRGWSSLQRPGAIVAEITYNHRARTANAGLRPMLFRHEIELPGEKATPGAEAIPLRDLRVRYDLNERRFVLHWPARGVEVVPVITSGVNPTGIISFLVAIGQQGFQPLGYFPGFEADGVTRWPRIVSGRTVLFRERWVFGPGDWPEGGDTRPAAGRAGATYVASGPAGTLSSDAGYFLDVARWRRRHALPRHVFVHSGEDPKPRYLDLESLLFVDHLRRGVKGTLTVTEMLPGPEDLWIGETKRRFASEFLVQMEGPEASCRPTLC